jgi:hypothetical protein
MPVTPKYRTENEEAMASSEALPFEPSRRRAEPMEIPSGPSPHQVAARGFAQTFGLHPAVAFVTIAVDLMVQAAVVGSGGLLIPLSAATGVVLAIITFMAQRKWYTDDNESAFIKSLIVGLLTAIPSPLPYMLFVPAGVVGFFRRNK